ncbi:MAG: arginine--tRNA ligase [Alphaproteobacteria bacterium]|jgi:arginyl-tRNA synthetase|nr:arginine--tRNA ligase [Alphaproteobacteria bacterium]
MNVFSSFRDEIEESIEALSAAGVLPTGLDCGALTVEPPRDSSHGDIATNAALVLAKQARMKPRDIALPLAEALGRHEAVIRAETAGPGFINLTLADDVWRQCLRDVLAAGLAYGDSTVGAGEKINVEYVSANPTGPLHVGHVRGAVFGDALAALLAKVGYDVCKEYYINDAGAQVAALARSTHLRYREALGEAIGPVPEGLYPGDYLKPVGAAIAEADGDKWCALREADWLPVFRERAVAAMMALIRDDLAALGVEQEIFFSEASLDAAGRIDEALAWLEEHGLIYTGVLEPPKGKKPEDWEPRPQTLFRATEFGDDVDRPLQKSDGSWTYFASDIAYHYDKYRRGFARMIDVWGADHGGYVKRMRAAVRALSEEKGDLDVRICQLVRLLRQGEPVKMSKRAGDFVTLREVVDEVGRDVVRFMMLTRKNDAPLDFDFVKVAEQSRDNPVFYVQYAHARIRSVMRNAARDLPAIDTAPEALAEADLTTLADSSELGLIKHLASWPRTVEAAAEAHEPHRIAFYLYDLASAFHALWNKGNDDARLRFIIAETPELTRARLALLEATRTVLASGLAVLGVEPVEEMR